MGSVVGFVNFAVAFSSLVVVASAACSYPALFCFGTSLSDTGNAAQISIFNRTLAPTLPYGETYFGRPSGRFCDGRTMVDFLAQAIGLPFLNPYLKYRKQDGTDYSHGVSYAVGGSTATPPAQLVTIPDLAFLSLYPLGTQLKWHLQFKQAAELPSGSSTPYSGVTLPAPSTFSEGLYFIEIGGNDYGSYFLTQRFLPGRRPLPLDNTYPLNTLVPKVVQIVLDAVETLYANDARNIVVLSLFPIGCTPLLLRYVNGSKDEFGCLPVVNDVDAAHNQRLLAGLQGLRNKYSDLNVMYADGNGAYFQILKSPASYGFTETIFTCCGAGPSAPYGFDLTNVCGPRSYNCPNPANNVIWDGIHNTDHANGLFINLVTSGEFLVPSNGLACASRV